MADSDAISRDENSMSNDSDISYAIDVDELSRTQLIELHEQTIRQVSLVVNEMAAVSSVLLGLAEGYEHLCRNAPLGRLGRAHHIDFLIQGAVDQYESMSRVAVARKGKRSSHQWTGLISSQIDANHRRGTLASRQTQRIEDLPVSLIKMEVSRLMDDLAIYRKRIAQDDVRIRQMALRWAEKCRYWTGFRYLFVESILRDAIVDYRIA